MFFIVFLSADNGDDAGTKLLLDCYIGRLATTLSSWVTNIVDSDFTKEPNATKDGELWTSGPVDFYRIIDEQLTMALDGGRYLVDSVVAESASAMLLYQQSSFEHLKKAEALSLDVVCALANNAERCKQLSIEFANRVIDLIGDSKAHQAVQAASSSFAQLGDSAIWSCINIVFSDPGFLQLLKKVGCSSNWISGQITASILATLDDFLEDFSQWLHQSRFRRFALCLLFETVSQYIAAILSQLKLVREGEINALRRDAKKIASFFRALVPEEAVEKDCQLLIESIIEWVSSDSIEAFVLSYTALLDMVPGVSPVLLSNLLTARIASGDGMTKADAREVSLVYMFAIEPYENNTGTK